MYFQLYTDSCNYNLKFEYPLNLVIGDSATGKTHLVSCIKKYKKDIITDCSEVIINLERWMIPNLPANSCVILDMDDMSSPDVIDAIATCDRHDVFFILLGRKYAKRLPVAIMNTFKLLDIKKVTRNVTMSDSNPIRYDEFSKVVVEDSCSGFTFFDAIFNDVESSKGAPGIIKAVNSESIDNTLLIFDSLGFGAYIEEFLDLCKLKDVAFICYNSFEYFILENLFNSTLIPKEINTEDAVTKLLRVYNANYSKSDGCTGDACFKCKLTCKTSSLAVLKKSNYRDVLNYYKHSSIPDDFEKWCAEFAPAVYADYSLEEKWNILQDVYNK